VQVAQGAGFDAGKVVVGYRKGVTELKPDHGDFFTQGAGDGRLPLGSWYVCSAIRD
jgi:hypothetical protein